MSWKRHLAWVNDKWRIVRDGVFDEQFVGMMLWCARFESPIIDMLKPY